MMELSAMHKTNYYIHSKSNDGRTMLNESFSNRGMSMYCKMATLPAAWIASIAAVDFVDWIAIVSCRRTVVYGTVEVVEEVDLVFGLVGERDKLFHVSACHVSRREDFSVSANVQIFDAKVGFVLAKSR